MKSSIIGKIITQRKITLFMAFIVMLMGVFSYYTAIKKESPPIEVPMAIIQYQFVGANAEKVDTQIMVPMEEKLKTMEGVVSTATYARNYGGMVFVEYAYDIDRNETFREVREIIDDSESWLPEEVVVTNMRLGVMPVTDFIYMVYGDTDLDVLEEEAEKIRENISKFEMVKEVDCQGQFFKQINMYITNTSVPVTRSNISNLIKSYDYALPGGKLYDGTKGVTISSEDGIDSLSDIESLILGLNPITKAPILIDDVTKTEVLEKDTIVTKYDGNQGIMLHGSFVKDEDQVRFADSFKEEINQLEEQLPEGVYLSEVIYYPDDVKASNNSFFLNLIIGVLLVMVISFVTMGPRHAMVVSFALPVSVLMTLTVMKGMHIDLQQVSIASLIIALGMLVDNAIVVTDAIKSKMEKGADKIEAAIVGTKEVAIPILTSTLTTIAAYSPLLFIQSIVGDYIISVPKVIIISLSASYIVAMTVMPCLCVIFFTDKDQKEKKHLFINMVDSIINKVLKKKVAVMISILLLTLLSVLAVSKIGLSFFPTDDGNFIYINVINKDGVTLEETVEKMAQVEAYIDGHRNINHYVTTIGGSVPRFYDTMRIYYPSADFGQFLCEVSLSDDYDNNTALAKDLQDDLNLLDDSLRIEVKELEKGEPFEAPITIKISGDSLSEIGKAKNEAMALLESIEGTTHVRDDEPIERESLSIDYNNQSIAEKSLVLPEVQGEVAMALSGGYVTDVYHQGKRMPVYITEALSGPEQIEELIVGYDGENPPKPIYLNEVAKIVPVNGRTAINRYNGSYTLTILGSVKEGYSSSQIMDAFEAKLDKEAYDVHYIYEGEQASISNNFGDLGTQSIFAVFLILIILMIQFNSFRQTFIILVSIPLSAIGAVFGLYIAGYPISFTALLGIVSLLGIVVNNAILLVDSVNKRIKEGLLMKEAVEVGVSRRIRPILLTTITTIVGLLPLVMAGDEMFTPMAIAIGAGLLFSTIITLLVIPILIGTSKKRIH